MTATHTLRERLETSNVQGVLYPLARALGIAGYAALNKAGIVAKCMDIANRGANSAEHVEKLLSDIEAARGSVVVERVEPARDTGDDSEVSEAVRKLLEVASKRGGIDEDAVREIVRGELGDVSGQLRDEMFEAIEQAAEKAAEKKTRRVEIVNRDTGESRDGGVQHERFPRLLRACSARLADGSRLIPWLYGPPGTGKSHAAKAVAEALDLSFAFSGALDSPYALIGFIDGGGRTIRTPFREVWEHGGVFLKDEIDGDDPTVAIAFNAALANGWCAFPDAVVERHADCVIIAAANTTGVGGGVNFAGAVRQNAATVDRFVGIEWPIDPVLEEHLSRDSRWLAAVHAARKVAKERGLDVAVSPRKVQQGDALLAAGADIEEVIEATLTLGVEITAARALSDAARSAWGAAK